MDATTFLDTAASDSTGIPIPWTSLAQQAGKLLGGLLGGGAGYAQNTGLHLAGSIDGTGLHANVFGNTTAGNNPWSASSAAELAQGLSKRIPSGFLGALQSSGQSIPIDITSPISSVDSIVSTFNQTLQRYGLIPNDLNKMADATTTTPATQAPDLTSAPAPAGTPGVAMPGNVGAGSTVAPDPKTYVQSTAAAAPDLTTLLVLGVVGYLLWANYNG